MNKDEAIVKIKEQLKKLMAFTAEAPAEEVKYESMKLKDGSEIMIPDGAGLETGVEVYMIDADGNQVPCEDGSYELESGQTITVKGGVIDAVSEAAQPEGEQTQSPEGDAQMAATTPGSGEAEAEGESAQQETAEADLPNRVAALEQQIAQILELLQGMSNAQEMAMSKIQEIAEAPAAPSIKIGKTLKSDANVAFNSVKDELKELQEMKKKFRIMGQGGYGFNAATTNK